MTKWTKNAAIDALKDAIAKIGALSNETPFSSEHVRWVANTIRLVEEVFGPASRYYLTLIQYDWSPRGAHPISTREVLAVGHEGVRRRIAQTAYVQQLDSARGLLLAAHDELSQAADVSDVFDAKGTGSQANLILKIINLAEHKLRKVIHKEPANEIEVQNAFESLLVGAEIPYDRDKVEFVYSSKTYKPDFTMDSIDTATEIKLCTSRAREKEIIAQINDDILAYKTQYNNLIFVVYDIGCIQHVDTFSEAFEKHDNVIVRVVKH